MEKYQNTGIDKTMVELNKQLMRYYTACHNDNAHLKAVEININNRLLPKIEGLIAQDMMEGGQHDVKYITWNKQPTLFVDHTAYCNYQAAQGKIMEKYGCPLAGDFDRMREGKKVLEMIDDLENISISDFCKKYYEPPVFHKLDVLVNNLQQLYKDENYRTGITTTRSIGGKIRFDNRANIAMMQFLNANREYYPSCYENGKLYFESDKREVDHIAARLAFSRKSENEDFSLYKMSIFMYHNKEEETHSRLDFDKIPLEVGKSFGKLFTQVTYPRCEAIIIASKKQDAELKQKLEMRHQKKKEGIEHE